MLGQSPAFASFERTNELSDSIKGVAFLEHLGDCQVLLLSEVSITAPRK
jgi:hypothetical protein